MKQKKGFIKWFDKIWDKYVNWLIKITIPLTNKAFMLGYKLSKYNRPFYFVIDNVEVIISLFLDIVASFSLILFLYFALINPFHLGIKIIIGVSTLHLITILVWIFQDRLKSLIKD